MKILCTGLTGVVGSYLSKLIINDRQLMDKISFYNIQRNEKSSSISSLFLQNIFYGSSSSKDSWLKVFRSFKPSVIMHIAQLSHVPAMLEALKEKEMSPFLIIVGTTSVFSKFDFYSRQYKDSEELLKKSRMRFVVLRPTMIYGHPKDRNIHKIFNKIKEKKLLILPDGGLSEYQPIYYKDISNALYFILKNIDNFKKDNSQRFYNLPGTERLTIKKMVYLFAGKLKTKVRILSFPLQAIYLTIKLFEILKCKLPLNSTQILRLKENKICKSDWGKLIKNYQPKKFLEVIDDYQQRSTNFYKDIL